MTEDWPVLPTVSSGEDRDLVLALYQARLEDVVNRRNAEYAADAARVAREAAMADQAVAAEDRLREAVHAAYLDVARTTLDRMLKRADLVVTIAAGAGAIYTTVLGLAYSADSHPVSAVAAVPALFLALALVLSAFYAGFVSREVRRGMPLASGTSAKVQHRRLADFVAWVNGTALDRSWALQVAILCLFVGTSTMPVAFLAHGQVALVVGAPVVAAVAGVALVRRPRRGTKP